MADVTEIRVTVRRVHNLGNYNSLQIEVSATAVVESGDDEAAITEGLREHCRNHVMAEIARSEPSLRPKVEKLFMGVRLRPVDTQGNFVDEETEDAG